MVVVMTDNNHTAEISKEAAVRVGESITYQGKELDLRKLLFAIHCWQNGISPWNGTLLTSKKEVRHD